MRVWQHGFYDHCLRDENSYLKHLRYVIENPVRKGWVTRPEDWPYSAVKPDLVTGAHGAPRDILTIGVTGRRLESAPDMD